eukprot:1148953-Pelagomonas_calceolata.AAC.3
MWVGKEKDIEKEGLTQSLASCFSKCCLLYITLSGLEKAGQKCGCKASILMARECASKFFIDTWQDTSVQSGFVLHALKIA